MQVREVPLAKRRKLKADSAIEKKCYQLSLDGFNPANDAAKVLAQSSTVDERGAIYTRIEVVDFILDLVGYTLDKPLYQMRLLEPSMGDGDFLIPAVGRMLNSLRQHVDISASPEKAERLISNAIVGVELHIETFTETRQKVIDLLINQGFTNRYANNLANGWLVQGDFLLTDVKNSFDFVVGNPPYVRQELIPAALLSEYRLRYCTIYDRADLYIPFIEKSLTSLDKEGQLGFICTDRWMKNKYGGPLRKFIADNFHLKFYVDMVDTPAFQKEVSTYPAITVFNRKKEKTTKIAHRPNIHSGELAHLASLMISNGPNDEVDVREVEGVVLGSEPWILESPDQLALVRRLEAKFPSIEEAGCKVGIGVATGLDKLYIGNFDELDVEVDRKLPLAMTRDIDGDCISWRGLGVINPFNNDGSLVDLNKYPRLSTYLHKHRHLISKRHVASKNPNNWYRTIDRIYPELATQPKHLIPDIKGKAHVVYERGNLYPHHNLYYITSETWDLKALQAVLKSGIARLFVSIYSTKIRGGYLRFQAQYLRRIRIPHWNDVPDQIKLDLKNASDSNDVIACNSAVFKLYGLSKAEREAIGGNGE